MAVQKTAKKNQDFELYAGEDESFFVDLVDANGDPYDVSGQTAYWAAAYKPSGAAILSKNTSGGITIVSTSRLRIDIADTDLDNEVFNGKNEREIVLYHYLKMVDLSNPNNFTLIDGSNFTLIDGSNFVLLEDTGLEESIALEGKIYLKNSSLRETP